MGHEPFKKVTRILNSTSTTNFKMEFENVPPLLARFCHLKTKDPGNKFRILTKIYGVGLPVPKPILWYDKRVDERFALYEFVEGDLSGPFLLRGINVNLGKLYEKYIRALVKIHKTNWKDLFQAARTVEFNG